MLTKEEAIQLSEYLNREARRLEDENGDIEETAWDQYNHALAVDHLLDNLFWFGNWNIVLD